MCGYRYHVKHRREYFCCEIYLYQQNILLTQCTRKQGSSKIFRMFFEFTILFSFRILFNNSRTVVSVLGHVQVQIKSHIYTAESIIWIFTWYWFHRTYRTYVRQIYFTGIKHFRRFSFTDIHHYVENTVDVLD